MSNKVSLEKLNKLLRKEGYVPSEDILITLFLAMELNKPILIEGPPGTGKTELAKNLHKPLIEIFSGFNAMTVLPLNKLLGNGIIKTATSFRKGKNLWNRRGCI